MTELALAFQREECFGHDCGSSRRCPGRYTDIATAFRNTTACVRFRSNTTEMIWVTYHSNISENDGAGEAAAELAQKGLSQHDAPENAIHPRKARK